MFYYQRGLASTSTPWRRPQQESILKYILRCEPVVKACGLNLWLSGRCLYDIANTWDVDCYLTGSSDPQIIEDIQHALLQEGFEHNLLVDPYWIEDHPTVYKDQYGTWRTKPAKVWLLYPIRHKSGVTDTTTDYRLDPRIPKITEYLVEFNYGQGPVNQKHWNYLNQYGKFQFQSAEDYLRQIKSK